MKTILEFNTENPDERDELARCMASEGMASVLWEVWANGRKKYERMIESGEISTPEEMLEKILEDIGEDLAEEGVNIDKIYQ